MNTSGLVILSIITAFSISCHRSQSKASTKLNMEAQTSIITGELSNSNFQKEHGIVGLIKGIKGPSGYQRSFCTGSLIAKNVVLTAAHCLMIDPGEELLGISVFFATDFEIVDKEILNKNFTHIRYVEDAIFPEKFKDSGGPQGFGDIALLRFAGEAPDGFHQVRLPPITFRPQPRDHIDLAGFGDSSYRPGNKGSMGIGRLRQAKPFMITEIIHQGERFVTRKQNDQNPCLGDSGAAAFDSNSPNTVVGLLIQVGTNQQKNCDSFGIYTSISSHRQWILDSLKILEETATEK